MFKAQLWSSLQEDSGSLVPVLNDWEHPVRGLCMTFMVQIKMSKTLNIPSSPHTSLGRNAWEVYTGVQQALSGEIPFKRM